LPPNPVTVCDPATAGPPEKRMTTMPAQKPTAALPLHECAGLLLLALLLAGPAAAESGTATVHLAGPAGATVWLDGRDLGTFPLAGPLALAPGTYTLHCTRHGYRSYEESLVVADDRTELYWRIRLLPLHRSTALTSGLLLAGLGQHYLNRPRLGYALNALELGGLVTALMGELSYQNHHDDYILLRADYRASVSETNIIRLHKLMDESYARMEDAERLRNIGLYVAGGAVVVGLLDAWLRFPSIEMGAGALPNRGRTAGGDGGAVVAPPSAACLQALHLGCRLGF
jgi:hypothetical protein